MNFLAPMARYLSGELVGLGATRRACTNRGTRPKSYDRGEPSGGLAGTAPRVIKGGWAQEVAWSPKHVPETAELHVVQEHAPERQLHN